MTELANAKINQLNVIITTEAVVKDPLVAKSYQQFQIINLLLDTLVRRSPDLGIVSSIAKNWSVSDDQKVYTFHISEKASFHDGSRVTPEDILFSFNRHLKDGSGSGIAIYLKNVLTNIEAVDNNKVRFTLRGPYPPFLELLSMSGFGIISHKSTDKNIVGSGPFNFETEQSNHWCLKKRKEYPFSTTNIEKYCFKIERDVEKTIEALNSKEVNLAMGSSLDVLNSKKLKNDYVSNPSFGLVATHIFLNKKNPFFKEKRNRELIANIAWSARKKNILTKFDEPLNTFFPKGIMLPDYYAASAVTDYSKTKLKNKEKIRIVFPYGIFLKSSVETIVAEYESAGFEVSYINVKGMELLKPIMDGSFDLVFIPYHGVIPDPDGYMDLISKNSVFAKAMLPADEVIEAISQARFIPNKEDRLKRYAAIFKELNDELMIIPFSHNSTPVIHHKDIIAPDFKYSWGLSLRDLKL